MSRYNRSQDRSWKDYLSQFVVIILTTFIIVWFLPRGEHFTMKFDLNHPWPHNRLIATYEFPIFKTEAQMQHERDSIKQQFKPYFELQVRVEMQQMEALRNAFRKRSAEALPVNYRNYVEAQLHAIYKRGIISTNDLQKLQEDNRTAIHIYHSTVATICPVEKLFTEKSAYEYIFSEAEKNGMSPQILQGLDLNLYLKSNITYDEKKSKEVLEDMEKLLSPSSGIVVAGQNIIDRGDIVDEKAYQILESYRRVQNELQNDSRKDDLVLLGQVLYVIVVLLCLVCYFDLFRQDYVSSVRSMLLLLALVLSFPLITSFLMRHSLLSVYLVPYTMLPIFIRVFMDSRTSFFTHVCTILLCAISLHYPYEFIVTQIVAGLIAIYSLRDLSERSQIFRTAIMVTLALLVTYLSLELINGRTFINDDLFNDDRWDTYIYMAVSGVLLLFAYPLMYLLERIFGFTSNVTLVELSNVNRDLLHRLSEQAPGTFQHSMMVSNLSAEVANKIGAKAQLVRTGALYHDIGKMLQPEYFTENQLGGINPHLRLSSKESAAIIIQHVTDGLELADRYRLPHAIRDFIATHHGRGLAKYFYITHKNEHPDEDIDVKDYTYPGPNPSTTEQAILMMVDAVEASARSLKEYTEESIGNLVESIIDGQMADGFFKECPITFADIQLAKSVLKDKLKTIYHTRVSYPTLNTNQTGSTSK